MPYAPIVLYYFKGSILLVKIRFDRALKTYTKIMGKKKVLQFCAERFALLNM